MAKITNIRERVHQPFRDALVRTSGNYVSNVQDRTELFTVAGGDQGKTNLQNGSTLPSDQSMVVLALRTFLWFRNPQLRAEDAAGNVTVNGDILPADFTPNRNTGIGSAEDVHRLYFQASEQLLWSVGAGQKYSLTSMPSAYFPYGGGLHGRLPTPAAGGPCCEVTTVVTDVPPGAQPASAVVEPVGDCCGDTFTIVVERQKFPDGWRVIFQRTTPRLLALYDVAELPATFTIPNVNGGPDCYKVTVYPPSTFGVSSITTLSATPSLRSSCGALSTLIHWNNGTPEAGSLTRLARAILIPPRQNILVSAQIVSYADNPQSAVATQGFRNLLSLTSNLNQQDYINKVVTMTIDGLLSRDVQ